MATSWALTGSVTFLIILLFKFISDNTLNYGTEVVTYPTVDIKGLYNNYYPYLLSI